MHLLPCILLSTLAVGASPYPGSAICPEFFRYQIREKVMSAFAIWKYVDPRPGFNNAAYQFEDNCTVTFFPRSGNSMVLASTRNESFDLVSSLIWDFHPALGETRQGSLKDNNTDTVYAEATVRTNDTDAEASKFTVYVLLDFNQCKLQEVRAFEIDPVQKDGLILGEGEMDGEQVTQEEL